MFAKVILSCSILCCVLPTGVRRPWVAATTAFVSVSRSETVAKYSPTCVSRYMSEFVSASRTIPALRVQKEDGVFYDDFAELFEASEETLESLTIPLPDRLPDFDDDDAASSNSNSNTSSDTNKITNNDSSFDSRNDINEFLFGDDIILSNYLGSSGFDEVTDWQYYRVDEATGKRTQVAPMPFDDTAPRRTRTSSGAVVRLFRGELVGRRGAVARSQGGDIRVLLKEYSGSQGLTLAHNEMRSLGLLKKGYSNENSKDKVFGPEQPPFTTLLGKLNLEEYFDDDTADPNEWYRALGVVPPKRDSLWLVFGYHGLSTAASYCVPLTVQRDKLPPKRGIFGNPVDAPPLPPLRSRQRYLVNGILRGMLQSVATAHQPNIDPDTALVHRSIGRNSFLLSSVGQDKTEAISPYATAIARLRVLLSDWGFAVPLAEVQYDGEFLRRANAMGLSTPTSETNDERYNRALMEFAKAEDLHALGFVYLALLFTVLAEPLSSASMDKKLASLPPTDEDTWQRLWNDIFENDIDEFRNYCNNEDVWKNVVKLLDQNEKAGWELLELLLQSRENVVDWYSKRDLEGDCVSAKSLLSHRFFQM